MRLGTWQVIRLQRLAPQAQASAAPIVAPGNSFGGGLGAATPANLSPAYTGWANWMDNAQQGAGTPPAQAVDTQPQVTE